MSTCSTDKSEATTATMHGQTVLVITPGPGRRGSITFAAGGKQFVVEGNKTLTADQLLAVAASMPVWG